jgi:hypothetical protein
MRASIVSRAPIARSDAAVIFSVVREHHIGSYGGQPFTKSLVCKDLK